jgi:hypothetical protein
MTQGTDGRDTDGAGSPGIVEEKNLEGAPTAVGPIGGADTDGAGSQGIIGENSRVAEAGETGLTRFGMADGDDTDGPGSGGILDEPAVDDGGDVDHGAGSLEGGRDA